MSKMLETLPVGEELDRLKQVVEEAGGVKEKGKESPYTLEEIAERLGTIDRRLEVQEVFTDYARGVPKTHLEIIASLNEGEIRVRLARVGSCQTSREDFASTSHQYFLREELFDPDFLSSLIEKAIEKIKKATESGEGGIPANLTPSKPFPGISYGDGYTAVRKPNGEWQLPS